MNSERTSTNNKENYKKRDIWIKDDNTKYKREVEQRYENLRKNQTEILEIKNSFSQTKKHSGKPRTSGRQILRAKR
jgi:hypothetical protein